MSSNVKIILYGSDVSSHFKNMTMVNRFSNLKIRKNQTHFGDPSSKITSRSDSPETKISAALKQKPDTKIPCKQIIIQFKLSQKKYETLEHIALLY